MKKIIFFFICFASIYSLNAQKEQFPAFEKTTYPIDSCLYFMTPFDLLINNQQTLNNGMFGIRTGFKSGMTSDTDFIVQGNGRFLIHPDQIPGGVSIDPGDQWKVTLTLPDDTIHNPDNQWNGGPLPFPVFLNGFILEIENIPLDPPVPISLQALQLEVMSLMD